MFRFSPELLDGAEAVPLESDLSKPSEKEVVATRCVDEKTRSPAFSSVRFPVDPAVLGVTLSCWNHWKLEKMAR